MSMVPKSFGARVRIAVATVALVISSLSSPVLQAQTSDLAALHAYAAAQRARDPAPVLPRHAFLYRSANTAVVLSPDGRQVAWLHENGQSHEVRLRGSAADEPRRVLVNTDAQSLSWTRDGRWLLLPSSREVFALAVAGQGGSRIVTPLGGRAKGELMGVDASQPGAVIVLEQAGSTPEGQTALWRLLRVDVHGNRRLLWEDRLRITDYALDAQGRLRWLQRLEGLALVIYRVESDGRQHELARCARLVRCALVSVAQAGGVWIRGDLGGDLSRLLRLDADGQVHEIHRDPKGIADIDDITLDPLTLQPLLVSYRSAEPATYALDADNAMHLAAIQRALPGRDLSFEVGRGAEACWLIRESAGSQQGQRWHLYDPRTRTLHMLFDDAPLDRRSGRPVQHVPESVTARALPLSWRASDGMRLHGLLWLPPGHYPSRLPLVVNVHGGPWNHFKLEFRAVTQFLVNRGYAVFEPNFRGSTGYGRHYLFAANGDFGNGRVQQDIVDGTRWLLANGIGDAQRVGITGASFGGYSALLGTTFQPELFKVGVAIAPPLDFAWTLRWILSNSEALQIGHFIALRDWMRIVSLDMDDGAVSARLHAQSPLANAARMNRPLLVVAGGEDQRVGLAGVLEYAARLKLAGKDASVLVDPLADHSMRRLYHEATFFAMETLLHAHLRGTRPEPPDGDIRAYLRRNLRLAGDDLRSYAISQGR